MPSYYHQKGTKSSVYLKVALNAISFQNVKPLLDRRSLGKTATHLVDVVTLPNLMSKQPIVFAGSILNPAELMRPGIRPDIGGPLRLAPWV